MPSTSTPPKHLHALRLARQALENDDAQALSKILTQKTISPEFFEGKLAFLLKTACEGGKPQTALFLLKEAKRRNQSLDERLFVASAFGGSVPIIKQVAAQFSKPSFFEQTKEEALTRAASQGHVEMVKHLIPQVKKSCRANALAWASHNGHAKVVKVLAPKSDVRFDSSLALQWAFKVGHRDVVDILLPVSDVEEAIKNLKKKWGTDPTVLRELKAYNERSLIKTALKKSPIVEKKSHPLPKRKM